MHGFLFIQLLMGRQENEAFLIERDIPSLCIETMIGQMHPQVRFDYLINIKHVHNKYAQSNIHNLLKYEYNYIYIIFV